MATVSEIEADLRAAAHRAEPDGPAEATSFSVADWAAAHQQENAPADADTSDEGEDQNPTLKEEVLTMNIIANNTFNDQPQALEPLRPIYGPSDERWAPLLAWLVEHAGELNDGRGADPQEFIDSMWPTERAGWHSERVLLIEWDKRADVAYPAMPETVGPSWATAHDDDVSIEDGTHSFPVRNWVHDFYLPDGGRASLGQMEYFNPETGELSRDPLEVTVSLAGQDELLTFRSSQETRAAVDALRNVSAVFEAAVGA